METKYLVDTNLLIYHTKGIDKATSFLLDLINREEFNISIVTKIEFLGWDKHTQEGFEKCKNLIELCGVVHIDDNIADRAIEIRRNIKTRLADAIVAATALKYGWTLATNNISDFEKLQDLSVHNPL